MGRVALYRKYRSADFDEIIGQNHITKTLEQALSRGLISHAYLLTGPRGVGKTSVARILARRVNNLERNADITQQLDIIEIDAASNRGIDEIRSLRERISSAPTVLPYKVYIIDEVHMLTREAFNALLKTLEEPPAHVIFILATTEAQKLPDTIISRTQRYDFRPIQDTDLQSHLADIAKREGIPVSEPAVALIARASRGGFRDAISMLDQLSAYDTAIDDGLVYQILGLSPLETIQTIAQALITYDAKVLGLVQQALSDGADPVMLTEQLIDYFRRDFLLMQAGKTPAYDGLAILDGLNIAIKDFKLTSQYSLPLELALYRLTTASAQVTPSTTPPASPVPPRMPATKAAPVAAVSDSTDAKARYTKALSYIKTKNNSLYAVMNMAESKIESNRLVLIFNFSFHRDRVEEPKNRRLIEAVMSKVFARPIELVCELQSTGQKPADPETELVSTALEILGGEVVDG